MNWFTLSLKNLKAKKLNTLLNVLLLAFGTGIITIIMLTASQIGKKLERNAKGIDAVVGAKGSPVQLILSSIYHIDFPTGNIPLKDAEKIMENPMVKTAVPLSLGDAYSNFRIAGTTHGFISLYNLKLKAGKLWEKPFEACIGANVARVQKLHTGDKFTSSHGLTSGGHTHNEHLYMVRGIFEESGTVADDLVLTSTESVWAMHGLHEEEKEHGEGNHDHDDHQASSGETVPEHEHDEDGGHEQVNEQESEGSSPYDIMKTGEKEITALLIQYRSPSALVTFPRYINQQTNMQAASPAQESARLFSLLGIGLNVLRWFSWLIIIISAFSVFISLYNSLKERKYDLAIMRTMGASRSKLFLLVLAEGMLLTFMATIAGLLWSHAAVELVGRYQDAEQAKLTGWVFLTGEYLLLAGGLLIGLIASVLPAIQAYRTDISGTLAKS